MSQLDDILDKAMGYDGNDYAEGFGLILELSQQITKQQLKDLMLELIGDVKPFVADDGREFLPLGEVTKKVQDL